MRDLLCSRFSPPPTLPVSAPAATAVSTAAPAATMKAAAAKAAATMESARRVTALEALETLLPKIPGFIFPAKI